VHGEYDDHNVRVQRYEHGRMYHTGHTGTHYLLGEICTAYVHLGEVRSGLGPPTSDPITVPDGTVSHCQHGGIYQRHGAAAHALWGNAYTAWQDVGGRTGPLGYPTTSWDSVPGGHYAYFQNGAIYDGTSTPLCVLTDPIDAAYRALDGFEGPLGWPTTGVTTLSDRIGSRVGFVTGEILSHPSHGTHALWGAIDTAYRRHGGQAGVLGYPTTDLVTSTAGNGSKGSLIFTATGAVTQVADNATAYAVWSHVYSAWLANGGTRGLLGFPVADMTVASDGNQHGGFQGGTVDYDAATGQTTVTPNK
jgi:uncharacterized protein with LGFP repeats